MKITVYQSKGSAGKTPIATNIALDREYAVGTNERFHVFEGFIPDERLLAVDLSEPFPTIPDDIDIVFDLAGAISKTSHSITSAIAQSNLVIVPIYNEVKSLTGGVGTLREVYPLNPSIVVVATKLRKQKGEIFSDDWTMSRDYQNIRTHVDSTCQHFGVRQPFPVLPLKQSNVFDVIFEEETSIRGLMQNSGLAAYTYRDVARQFDAIYDTIDGMTHAAEKQPLCA